MKFTENPVAALLDTAASASQAAASIKEADDVFKRSSYDGLKQKIQMKELTDSEEIKKMSIASCIKISILTKCGNFIPSKTHHLYDDIALFSEESIVKRIPAYNKTNWYKPVVSNYRVEKLESGIKLVKWEEKYLGRFDKGHVHHVTEYEVPFYRGKIANEDTIYAVEESFNNLKNDLLIYQKNVTSSKCILESDFVEIHFFIEKALGGLLYSETLNNTLRNLKIALNELTVVKSEAERNAFLNKEKESALRGFYESGQYQEVRKESSSNTMKRKAIIKMAEKAFEEKNFIESFGQYRKALDLFDNKKEFKHYAKIAVCLHREGHYEESLSNAELALEINILDLEAKNIKKEALVSLINNIKKNLNPDKYELLGYYDKLINISKEIDKVVYAAEAANLMMNCDDYKNALKFARYALNLDPDLEIAQDILEKCSSMDLSGDCSYSGDLTSWLKG